MSDYLNNTRYFSNQTEVTRIRNNLFHKKVEQILKKNTEKIEVIN